MRYLDGHVEHLNGPIQLLFDKWQHVDIEVVPHQRSVASEHQAIDVVYRDGRFERIQGPSEVLFDPFVHKSCTVNTIKTFVASQAEYLVIQYKDGRKDHVRGPKTINFHPLEHEKVTVHDALRLAANEAVVVYRRHAHAADGPSLLAKLEVMPIKQMGASASTEQPAVGESVAGIETAAGTPLLTTEPAGQEGAMHVERRVVHGPAVFMPDSNEWLHTFSWHGSVSADGKGSKTGYVGDRKVPHALNFQVLRIMPDSMYLSVRDVRTVDDASLTVHLMLFYELQSIETMLDSTNDMIGDFVNAASADVMTFASRLTYEMFLQETAELSRVETFPILSSRMQQTGNALLKVVYRGYGASDQLQQMHDEAISRRTRLRLEADAAREEQERRAMELRARQSRSAQEQELERAAAAHKLQLRALEQEQQRKAADEEHARNLRHAQEKAEMELAHERARYEEELRRARQQSELDMANLRATHEQELKKFEGFRELGVDLTSYLVALATVKPDQHLKIDAGGGVPPAVHLELPRSKGDR